MTAPAPYGQRRDYPKIEISILGRDGSWSYWRTTTWSRTLAEAKAVSLARWNFERPKSERLTSDQMRAAYRYRKGEGDRR